MMSTDATKPLVEPYSGVQPRYDLTADEHIRMKALELTVAQCAGPNGGSSEDVYWRAFWDMASSFENYLRNGQ